MNFRALPLRLVFSSVIVLMVSCSGCRSGSEKDPGGIASGAPRWGQGVDTPIFARVEDKLTVTRSGSLRTVYNVGKQKKTPLLSFRIWNRNLKLMQLEEWHKRETDNIRLSVAFCEKGKAGELPKDAWKEVWPEKKPAAGMPVPRQPQGIASGTCLTVDVPMNFLEDLKLKDGAVRNLAVKAETNLVSVPCEPCIFEIAVRNRPPNVKEFIFAD